jgi:CRISPR-associated protein Cmr2
MSRYLVAFSIGPVQGFIAAARRTRDLWMGSTILSEIAKAVAKWIAEQPPEEDPDQRLQRLIFPAPADFQSLAPWRFSSLGDPPPDDFSVSNVILALVETDDPRGFAAVARERAEDKWSEFVDFIERTERHPSTGKLRPFADVDKPTWRRQRSRRFDVVEFYSAWAEMPVEKASYEAVRRRVMRVLEGRKACRTFTPWVGEYGRPKSSLDAARESVLVPYEARRSNLRAGRQEQLDIVGMVKRIEFGNDSIRYPSVSRFAADPWIRGVLAAPSSRSRMDRIGSLCSALVDLGALTQRGQSPGRPRENDLDKFGWLAEFPFEGTPLYVSRHQEIRNELGQGLPKDGDDEAAWLSRRNRVNELLGLIDVEVRALSVTHGYPEPYLAVLAADGDGMGETISRLAQMNDPAVHRAFSRAQTRFADQVRKRINGSSIRADGISDDEKFRGATIYAGADDVLAFLPVDQAIRCARMLHELFERTLEGELRRSVPDALSYLRASGPFPSLSVGVAVGHFMDPLENLLHYAHEAEQRAKYPSPDEQSRGQTAKNALAVAVHPRGGAPFIVRDNWDRGIDRRLTRWTELHRDKLLPTKAAYDLRDIARQYDAPWVDDGARATALRADALRVLERKRGSGIGQSGKRHLHQLIAGGDGRDGVATGDDLRALAHELICGQWIERAQSQAAGEQADGRAATVDVQ